MRRWIEYLAGDIGPRPYSRPEVLKEVSGSLEEAFATLGYSVERQPLSYKGHTYYNITGFPAESSHASQDPILVVGAHYDTVAFTPGADDNASGIAGLIELARILADRPPLGLRLVAFCLEEPPAFRTRNMGSYKYAKSLRKNRISVRGMICLEMIGFFSDKPGSQAFPLFFMDRIYPDAGNFIALAGNMRSRTWTLEVKKHFASGTSLPVESINAPAIVIGVDFSDHWSFNKFRYPAVMVTDTAFYRNPNYHRVTDTPETLDYVRAAKVVDGLANAVRNLA